MAEDKIIEALTSNNLELFRVAITTPGVLINDILDGGILHYIIKHYPETNIEFYKSLLQLESCDINKSCQIDIRIGASVHIVSNLPIMLIDWKRKELLELFLSNEKLNLTKLDHHTKCIHNKAIDENNKQVLDLLVEKDVFNMTRTLLIEKYAPLNYAMDNNMELFQYLINKQGVNINRSAVFVPIQYAVETNNIEAFKILLDAGATVTLGLRYDLDESALNSNSNSSFGRIEHHMEKFRQKTSIVSLFEYIMLNNKREMFDYLLSKLTTIGGNLKNIEILNVIKPYFVQTLLDRMDIFNDNHLEHVNQLLKVIKDKYIHLVFDKMIEGYLTHKLTRLTSLKKNIHKRCIEKADLELYKKCIKLVLNDTQDYDYVLSLVHILKAEDIDFLRELKDEEEYDFFPILDRIKFSESVIRENKVDDFIQIMIEPLDMAEHFTENTLNHLIHYEKTIKKLIPHLSYEDGLASNGVILFKKVCKLLKNGPLTQYTHINDLLSYIIDNSNFCSEFVKYNLPNILPNLEFNQELMAYLLSKTDLSAVSIEQSGEIEEYLRILYNQNYSAFSNFFEELAKLKFDNLHNVMESGPFLQVMKDEAGAEAFDVIMDGFIENHPEFIKLHAKEILELEYTIDDYTFFKHYPLIISLNDVSIDLLNLFLVEEEDYDQYGDYYTYKRVKHLDDEQYENIKKLLDYDNVYVQNFFAGLIGKQDCPVDILERIIDHPKFEGYVNCEYDGGLMTPLHWILYTISNEPNYKNERYSNLIHILNYLINHEKIEEINIHASNSMAMIELVNKVGEYNGFFKMEEDYYNDAGLNNNLGHALQIVLKHSKFTYNLDNSIILKEAGIYCNSIHFIKYLLSKPEIDYNNGTLHAIISEGAGVKLELTKLFLTLDRFDVNAKDDSGRTVLHEAIYDGNVDIVKLILEHPAIDLTITNNKSKNYLQIARKAGRLEIQELLKTRGLVDDKKERLERLELEYSERMKAQGRIMRTRIRDIIGNFELVLTEADDPDPNNTLYQTTICPFCLVYLEKESPGECLYMKHQCAHEIRNEELMTKYLGAARMDEGFELCVTCGRPGLNHGHCDFNQPPEGRQLEAIKDGGNSWTCNSLIGGGGRIEMIARITIMASYIKKKFDESQTTGEKLKYDRALIKTLTDLVDNVLSSQSDERDEIFERAEEIFDRSKFDKNSKIPSYAKFNATNEEVREIEAQLEAERQLEERRRGKMAASNVNEEEHKRFIEPLKVIRNDGSLLCVACSEPMPILYQAHDEDTFYICSYDLQAQMMDVEPGKSKKCILGCNLSKKKLDARGILLPGQHNTISEYERLRLTKQIYRDEVEKLDDGEFFSKDYSDEQPMNIAQPLEEMEKTIEKIEKSEYHQTEGSSSGASSSSNGAGPSNPAEAIMNALTREMRRLQRYKEKHGEDPEEGEIIENSNSE